MNLFTLLSFILVPDIILKKKNKDMYYENYVNLWKSGEVYLYELNFWLDKEELIKHYQYYQELY